jgi:hypothetical protein
MLMRYVDNAMIKPLTKHTTHKQHLSSASKAVGKQEPEQQLIDETRDCTHEG